jgi:hypothetical protein
MTTPLNLYAAKVFAEHPISMWALDESVGYISLVSENIAGMSGWDVVGATVVDATEEASFSEIPPKAPFSDTPVVGFVESLSNNGLINISLSESVLDNKINPSLGSVSLGLYAFTYDRTVQARLGFSYVNSETLEEYEVLRLVNIPPTRSWAFVAETFGLPENVSNIKPIIEFSYSETEALYEIAINGISFGQWSEEFQTESLGVMPENLPSSIPLNAKGIAAQPYGLQGDNGYYIASENSLYAKNLGVPLVFGSFNSTVIYPNELGKPSLIIPGEGFLNKSGQYKPLTAEFWTNIQSNAVSPKKIFGPLMSEDGIYVDKHLIKLKVGNHLGSYAVKEWGRPMLVAVRLTYRSASLLINGEEVISLSISPEAVNYPEQLDGQINQDWLGFYAYEDVPLIQIEAVAIYPYEVAAIVQKRRFIYGQGVDFPVSSRGLDVSTTIAIDYSLSNYAKNVNYPQTSSWSSGYSDNIEFDETRLYLPNYVAPEIYLQNSQKSEWLSDNYNAYSEDSPAIMLKPNPSWEEIGGYLYLKDLRDIKEQSKSFYGLFEPGTDMASKQILLRAENVAEGSFLNIYLENQRVVYSLEFLENGSLVEEVFYASETIASGKKFCACLDIAAASSEFGSRVSSFLSNIQNSKFYIGGSQSFKNTFSGKIVKVVFSGIRNFQKIQNVFASTGVALDYHPESSGDLASDTNKETHVGTYTVMPASQLGSFYLDVAADSYWEDYVPLSYLGKYVKDYEGNDFFALSFIQFNIDYVKLNRFIDNAYDTSGMPIKTYVSFQYLADGANANQSYFTRTEPLSKTGIVAPREDWITTRYEVLNDSVIKLPPGQDFSSLALVISIEFLSLGVASDSLSIDSLSLASQALGQNPNQISTRFGPKIIPFKKSGLYFEYRNVQPFTIHKKESPYLYLTKNSGIRMRGEYNATDHNGLSIPINKNMSDFFKINLFQMFLRYEGEGFPTSPTQLFELQTSSSLIKFFLVADSNTQQRGQVYAIDDTSGTLKSGIIYYVDGKVVKRPILNLNSWTILGMSFDEPQDFSSITGALRFTSPILFNNVSYYQTTQLDESQRFAYRKWFAVRSGIDNPLDWGYWAGKDQTPGGEVYVVSDGFSWQEVLFLTEAEPTVPDASQVYKQYTGTNSVVFDTDSSLRLFNYSSSVLRNVGWSNSVSTPV